LAERLPQEARVPRTDVRGENDKGAIPPTSKQSSHGQMTMEWDATETILCVIIVPNAGFAEHVSSEKGASR